MRVFALIVGVLLISVSIHSIHIDFPTIERDWQEIAALIFGGACLEWARGIFINDREGRKK